MTALAKFIAAHPELTTAERDLLTRYDASLVVRFEVTDAGRAVLNTSRPATPCS